MGNLCFKRLCRDDLEERDFIIIVDDSLDMGLFESVKLYSGCGLEMTCCFAESGEQTMSNYKEKYFLETSTFLGKIGSRWDLNPHHSHSGYRITWNYS